MQLTSVLLLAILVCAAILRFWGLDFSSLWSDELDTWILVNEQALPAVIETVKADAHPPLYFVLLHYVTRYLGDGEWMMRMPSAIAGIAAVYAIYTLGRRLYTRREGLVAASIMAVSWAPIFYSQEARAYSFLMLVGIILFHFWLRLMRAFEVNDKLPFAIYAGYVLAATCLSYLHYFGFQLVVLQMLGFVVLFLFRPHILLRITVVFGLIFLAYWWWLPVMFAQMAAKTSLWIPPSTLPQAFASFTGFSFHVNDWILFWFVLPAYAVAAISGLRWMRGDSQTRSWREFVFSPGGMLLLWAMLPFLAAFVQSIVLKPILVDRYLIVSLPAVYLLLARGIAVMPKLIVPVWTFALCTAILLSVVFDHHYYSKPQKEQFREVVTHVVGLQGPYRNLPVVAFTMRQGYFDYYLERLGFPQRVSLLAGKEGDIGALQNFLQSRNGAGFWYLVGLRTPDKEFLDVLEEGYTLANKIELSGTSARLYLARK